MKTQIDDNCILEWENLKMGKKHRYIIYNIDQKEQIIVESIGERTATFNDFVKKLPEDDLRYCVFDLEFTNSDNMHINKLLFIFWSPETCKSKRKLLFAASKQNLKKVVSGVVKDIQATCWEDLNQQEFIKNFS